MTDAVPEAMTHDCLPMWSGCQECLAVWLRRTAEYFEGRTPTTPLPAGHDHRDHEFDPMMRQEYPYNAVIRQFTTCDECGGQPNSHPTRHIRWKNSAACVDEHIADLIVAMWKCGIRTDACCQDAHDDGPAGGIGSVAYIKFSAMSDLERCANAVIRKPRDAMYHRIVGHAAQYREGPAWVWDFSLRDRTYRGELDEDWGAPSAMFLPVLTIPSFDVVAATKRLLASLPKAIDYSAKRHIQG